MPCRQDKKQKSHNQLSKRGGEAFDKIQPPFMMETLNRLGIKGNFLKLIKGIYEKPTANILPNGERRDIFLILKTRQSSHYLATSVQYGT